MKTHIIYLDQEDNLVSITDKLSWGKAQRVLLVFPPSPCFKIQKIELLLIKRATKKMGFLLGIVSRKKNIKKLALEVGIPVFKSIKYAQRKKWKAPVSYRYNHFSRKSVSEIKKKDFGFKTKEPDWMNFLWVRLLFFSLGVLSVLLVLILFIPSAKIKLNLQDQEQTIFLQIEANEAVEVVNLSGIIPVHTIDVSVEGTRLVKINTRTSVPDKYSIGKILFTNLTENKVGIPLGMIITRLDNSGIRFEVIEKGDLQGGVGQTIELPIRALTPGKAGNMEANSLGSLIGDIGTSLLANNPNPSYGGTDIMTKMANEIDRSELKDQLESDLRDEAIQSAQELLSEGDILFPETIKLEEIIKETYVPIAGQPGDRLSIDLKISYSIQYAEHSDLVMLGETVLNADLPEGYLPLSGDYIKFDLLKNPSTDSKGTTTLSLKAHRRVIREINSLKISGLINGLSAHDAYKFLNEEYGLDIRPVIVISPYWWNRVPIVPLRIAIED